jgi:hypothetical protein
MTWRTSPTVCAALGGVVAEAFREACPRPWTPSPAKRSTHGEGLSALVAAPTPEHAGSIGRDLPRPASSRRCCRWHPRAAIHTPSRGVARHRRGLDLYADAERALPRPPIRTPVTCAQLRRALHHAVVGLARWLAGRGRRFRTPNSPTCLPRSAPARRRVGLDVALAAAIPRRSTDRRMYSSWTVATADIAMMGAARSCRGEAASGAAAARAVRDRGAPLASTPPTMST